MQGFILQAIPNIRFATSTSTEPPIDQLADYSNIARSLNAIAIFISIFGFVGNYLTFATSRKLSEKDQSSGNVYMKSLAIADSVCLARGGIFVSGLHLVQYPVYNMNKWICKFTVLYGSSAFITGRCCFQSDICLLIVPIFLVKWDWIICMN